MKGRLVLSPSRVEKLRQCQLSYYYRYEAGLPGRYGAAAARGSIAHEVAEAGFLGGPRAAEAKAGELSGDGFVERFKVPFDYETWESGVWQGLQIGAHFTKRLAAERAAGSQVFVEYRVKRRIGVATVLGIMDMVIISDDKITIIDHKTGKKPRSGSIVGMLAPRVYTLLAKHIWGGLPVVVEYSYYNEKAGLFVEPTTYTAVDECMIDPTDELVAAHNEVHALVASGDWRPSPSPLCGYCEGRDACPWAEQKKESN